MAETLSLIRWRIALVIWMVLIFLVSSGLLSGSMSADSTEEFFGDLNYVVRKLAHLFEYAVLVFLWLRALLKDGKDFENRLRWGFLLSVVYAVTDEVHQSFVPNRLGTWTDVVYDAVGATIAAFVLRRTWASGGEEIQRRLFGPLAPKGPSQPNPD